MPSRLIISLFWILQLFPHLIFPAQSDSGQIFVLQNQARLTFPTSLVFRIAAKAGSGMIDRVSLVYGSSGRTCQEQEARQDLKFDPAAEISLQWEWKMDETGSPPPTSQVWWRWEIHTSAGAAWTTEQQTIPIEDQNFEWFKLQNSAITVYWAEGDLQFGQYLLEQATRSLERLAKEIGVTAPPAIRIVDYPKAADVLRAMPQLPSWVGGVALAEHSTVLIAASPDQTDWAAQVIHHELAHLVVDARIYNCQGNSLTTWLSEGLATYSEGPLSAESRQGVITALKDGTLPELGFLSSGFSGNSRLADLEYNLSALVVEHLVKTYGPQKIDALLGLIQQGELVETALQETYALNIRGVDQALRAALGLAVPTTSGTSVPTSAAKRTAIPTFALWTVAAASPSATQVPAATVGVLPSPTSTSAPATPLPLPESPTAAPTAPAAPTASPTPDAGSGPQAGAGWVGLAAVLAAAGAGYGFYRFLLSRSAPKG